jgi:hypothetical protein
LGPTFENGRVKQVFAVRFRAWLKGYTLSSKLPTLILSAAIACAAGVSQDHAAGTPQENAVQLVSEVVANELRAQEVDHSLWSYRQTQHQGGGSEELEVVETPLGSIHRLLQRNGRQLDPEAAKKEDSRIAQVVAHPDPIRKRAREEQKDGKQEADFLRMLPDALDFQYSAINNGVVTLEFTPRSSFKPHHHEGELFHHMSGRLLIDALQKRLVEIDGHLTSEVKFGGGILGHLDKGGTFIVNQKDVGGGHWEMTRLVITMNGKALFFKTIDVHHDEQNVDFRPVREEITLQEAAELLHGAPSTPRQAQQGSQSQ